MRESSAADQPRRPVRVCFISLLAYPYFNPEVDALSGGAELQLYYMSTELAKSGEFEISLVTGDYGQADFEQREGVTLYKLKSPPADFPYVRGALRLWRLWRLLRRVDARVFILRAWGSVVGEVALFCRTRKAGLVYMTGHDEDLLPAGKPSWLPGGLRSYLQWKIFTAGLRRADLIVVQHSGQAEQCDAIFPGKCLTRPSAHRRGSRRSPQGRKGFVLWVGRCERWKRPEIYFDLAAEFPSRQFVMVCPSSSDHAYFEQTRDRGLRVPNLRFVDGVPFREVREYFLSAAIFVNTSASEGFPNTFVQAAQSGTPIISLSVNPDGILETYGIGSFAAESFGALCKAVEELYDDRRLWEQTSRRATRYFEEHHDIEEITLRDRDIIRRFAGRG